MSHRFLSREYLDEAARRIGSDADYQEAARGFDDTVCFVVEPEPDRGVTERYVAGMDLPAASEVWVGEDRPAGFTFTAPYGVFVDMMTGALDPVRAMTQRKLKVAGSMPKLLRYVKGTQSLMRVLQGIPTQFDGTYSSRDFGS
ncbi:MAG: SCP2 sterol-binding domain-containing protein [Acidobacteria bacterium]|nr:SCP2 sterol-binding domain-containing protein [Acidobacteriota bacterium]